MELEQLNIKNKMEEYANEEKAIRALLPIFQAEKEPSEDFLEMFFNVSEQFLRRSIGGALKHLRKQLPEEFKAIKPESKQFCYANENYYVYLVNQHLAAGWEGLKKAAKKFNFTDKETSFEGYAYKFIEHEVINDWNSQREFDNVHDREHRITFTSGDADNENAEGGDGQMWDVIVGKELKYGNEFVCTQDILSGLISERDKEVLYDAIDHLSPTTREVIEMLYGISRDKMTRAEIEKETGLPGNVINDIVNYGLASLRAELEAA